MEDYFIFRCPIYYETTGWFHWLFSESPNFIYPFFVPEPKMPSPFNVGGPRP